MAVAFGYLAPAMLATRLGAGIGERSVLGSVDERVLWWHAWNCGESDI
jgi:hypothetical protein